MNFLAHIYLSGHNDLLKIGNFIGDFVKGKAIENYSNEVQKGIRLHRMIDEYTDNHPTVLQSKIRLRPKYRHYAPVIVDVYYDHFLASLWSNYSEYELKQYCQNFYDLTDSYYNIIPTRARHMLVHMKKGNWLYNYQFLEGIHLALSGMSRRTTHKSYMEGSVEDLKANYEAFKAEFVEFFPDLDTESEKYINSSI